MQVFLEVESRGYQVICHRGLCSKFPQNTREAILGAIQLADLTEFDVQITKDLQIVVFHDRTLDRITDVATFPEFAERVKTEIIDEHKEPITGYWVRDFTLAELKALSVRQTVPGRPELPGVRFEISTLEEIIQQCIEYKKNLPGNEGGLLVQIKSQMASRTTQRDQIMCRKITELLKKYGLNTIQGCKNNHLPIVLQTFNKQMLLYIQDCENQVYQLYEDYEPLTQEILRKYHFQHLNLRGIGVGMKSLLNSEGQPTRALREICDELKYCLNFWSIIEDSPKPIPYGCASYQEFYIKLAKLGVTGFITQFPENCFKALREHCQVTEVQSQEMHCSEDLLPVEQIQPIRLEEFFRLQRARNNTS